MKQRPHRERGFTLIELLTVIVIIAILAGLLFPVFGRAQEKGNRTKCLSNLRQWGMSMTTYLAEHNGVFPEEGADAGDMIVLGSPQAWFNVLAPYVSEVPLTNRVGGSRRAPMPRPKDNSLFTCPTATMKDLLDYQQSSGKTIGEDQPFMSYAYNRWIDASERESGSYRYGRILRLSQIVKPAQFVVWGDSRGLAGNCSAPTLDYRHDAGTSANLGFADGHAGTFLEADIYDPSINTNKGGIIWNPEAD